MEEEKLDLDDNKIIKNKELEKYVKFKLCKDEYTVEDLDTITEIVLNSKTITDKFNYVFFEEINLFKNLEDIKFFNLGITYEVTDIIKKTNVKFISFINCEINTLDGLDKIESMYINNSTIEIESFPQLNNLKSLYLISLNIDDFDFLKNYTTLKELYFCYMTQENLKKVPELDSLTFLSIDGIDNFAFDDIIKFKNLKTLSVGKQDLESYKYEFAKVKSNNIEIVVEDSYDEL